jgi:hypothetical protein
MDVANSMGPVDPGCQTRNVAEEQPDWITQLFDGLAAVRLDRATA